MKKILLGTTAICAAGVIVSAPSAMAAEKLSVSVGGYMEQWFGYVSADDDTTGSDFTGFDQKSDAEIHFKGMTTLDNGIQIGVNVQLEANTNTGDQIDESYLIVKGSFGEINIGSENSAMYKMHYAPSEFGIGMNSGDQVDWVNTQGITSGGYFRAPYGSTYVEPGRANDSEKLTYYTPRISGFQLGVSYGPDANQDTNVQPNRDGAVSDLVTVGVNYQQTFANNVALGLSGGWGTYTNSPDGVDEPTAFNLGATIVIGGFGFGGSYAQFDESGASDGEGLNIGAWYSSGPWGVSIGYFTGDRDGTKTTVGGVTTLSGNAEQDTFMLSGKYALGPGITAAGTIGHTTFASDDTALTGGADDVEGTYVVVGMKVSF